MTSAQSKNLLRTQMREIRNTLSTQDREDAARVICERLQSLEIGSTRTIATYLSTRFEANVDAATQHWIEQGHRVVAPLGGIKPKFGVLHSLGEVQTNARGVRLPARHDKAVAPREVDVVVVPGLAFDRSGARLGQGGGWYDRALHQAGKGRAEGNPLLVVGVCFDCQLLEQVPSEAHDERVDVVITESQLLQVAASLHK